MKETTQAELNAVKSLLSQLLPDPSAPLRNTYQEERVRNALAFLPLIEEAPEEEILATCKYIREIIQPFIEQLGERPTDPPPDSGARIKVADSSGEVIIKE